MILLNADLSQVEARVELLLAAATEGVAGTDVAKECIRLATAHPAEFDIHRYAAAVALGKSEVDVTDIAPPDAPSDRQIGKTTMHGFMRGMGAETMSDGLMKSGYVVTSETCAQRLGRLAAKLPAIPHGYFPDIRRQAMRFRALGTTWGGIYRCDWQRFDEALYGVMYSYPPVRETVDLINQRGFLPLRTAIALRRLNPIVGRPAPRIHVHGHDSLTLSVHWEDAWPVATFIDQTLGGTVRHYAAGALRVPVTYALGETWKARYEFKRLPSREEFRAAAWDCEQRGQASNG
jgi:hypothetical protein